MILDFIVFSVVRTTDSGEKNKFGGLAREKRLEDIRIFQSN